MVDIIIPLLFYFLSKAWPVLKLGIDFRCYSDINWSAAEDSVRQGDHRTSAGHYERLVVGGSYIILLVFL